MTRQWAKPFVILLTVLFFNLYATAKEQRDTLGAGTQVAFIENLGQWDMQVRFEAQLHNAAIFLESDAITVALRDPIPHPAPFLSQPRYHAYRMTFSGATPVTPSGDNLLPGYSNYFLGNNPARWKSNVHSYGSVRYDNLYPGIALEIYGGTLAMKYNFIVSPNADASQIAIHYEGADKLNISRDGSLQVHTSVRTVMEMKPYVFQMVDGKEVEVGSRWQLSGNTVTIHLDDYDHGRELVIDPVLIFSTYTGSTADNWGTTAAYDSHKNAYTAGLVFNIGYPVSTGAYQPTIGGSVDIGIFKFDTIGQNRLYATYLGGTSADMPHSLFVNSFDELIILGTTGSQNFPVTAGAYQTAHAGGPVLYYESPDIGYDNGSDLFVSRLSADGAQLLASTYIGGAGNDGLNFRNEYNNDLLVLMGGNDSLYYNYGDGARGEIITDNINNIYVGTTTMSADFPVTGGCVQSTNGGRQDGVVFKLDHNLRNLLWSTYLGGSHDDAVYSIDVDSAYNLLVCGGTNSGDFPVTGSGFQRSYGGGSADGFVCKISYSGNRLLASTYMGGDAYDQLYFVRTGRHDEVFLFGQSLSGNSMIYNAGYSVFNSGMLLARLAPDLSSRVWSTLFGTPGRVNLSPTAFAADICNRVYAAGWGRDFVPYMTTWNTLGTTGMETSANAYSDTTDGQDFYIISIDRDANTLDYATFFGEMHDSGNSRGGGDHVDGGTSRFDRLGTLYQSVCASCGGYNGFPTTAEAWSNSNRSSNCNNALFRFNVTNDFPVAEFIPPTAGCAPYNVQFQNTGRGTSFFWDFGDGTTSTLANPSHTYAVGGIYTVTLVAYMDYGCAASDTQQHTLHVIGNPGGFSYSVCNGNSVQIGLQPQIGATYQWLTPGVSDPSLANPWVDQPGTYLLRISATGCSEVDTFKLFSYQLIDSWQPTAISCRGYHDGSATFLINADSDPDSVSVSIVPSAHMTRTGRTVTFDSLGPDTRYLVTFSGYGCSTEQEVLFDDPPLPLYTKQVSSPLCSDSCLGWVHITYNLSAIPEVPPRDTIVDSLCEGIHITHFVNLGCPQSDTTRILRNHLLDSLHAWAESYHIYLGESVRLHADLEREVDGITYLWSPAADLDNPASQAPVATPADTLTLYRVVASSPSDGCTAADSLLISTKVIHCGEPDFVIPNAFTPNGDGVNDVLDLTNDILSELEISIFNRWGECVFSSSDPSGCRWDGTFRNQPCLPGVYTYTCHLRCHNGVENDLKGDITLIR